MHQGTLVITIVHSLDTSTGFVGLTGLQTTQRYQTFSVTVSPQPSQRLDHWFTVDCTCPSCGQKLQIEVRQVCYRLSSSKIRIVSYRILEFATKLAFIVGESFPIFWILAALVFGLIFCILRELLHSSTGAAAVTWIALFAALSYFVIKDIQSDDSRPFRNGKLLVRARRKHVSSGQHEIITAFTRAYLKRPLHNHGIFSATGPIGSVEF